MRSTTLQDARTRQDNSWLSGMLGRRTTQSEPLGRTGLGQKQRAQSELPEVSLGPVTHQFAEETRAKTKTTLHSIGASVQRFFRNGTIAVAGCALGAMLLTGCASLHTRGPVGSPLTQGSTMVTMAPSTNVHRTSLEIDSRVVKQRIAQMEETIMKGATPAMAMLTDNSAFNHTVYGDYKKHIIPEYTVTNPTGKEMTVELIFLLPVSGHVGNTLREQQENAVHYAEIDRHKVWIEYADGTKQTLIENIDPKGKLVVPVKLTVTLKPGENQIVFSPLPDGRPELKCHDHSFPVDPAGFDVGRRQIYKVE